MLFISPKMLSGSWYIQFFVILLLSVQRFKIEEEAENGIIKHHEMVCMNYHL